MSSILRSLVVSTIICLILPTQLLGFAPSLSIASKSFSSLSPSSLFSTPFDDTPSPLQEDSNDSYDSYECGTSTSIVTKDISPGSGEITAETDDVLTVSLIGKVIQSNNEFLKNEKYSFELGSDNTFPGFNEGLLGSKVGTKRYIKVPPNRAYGKRGAKGVPPMADLIFEVDVQDIARGPVQRIIAKIGTDRLAGFAVLTLILAITPFLPQ
jgi:hypothetical protein